MTSMTLDGHQGRTVAIDLCVACQAFWFDKYENLQLAPGSTLQLMKLIGERPATAPISFSNSLQCPRCADPLPLTRDMVRNARFTYWRCKNGHGHYIRFFEFLREKNFIRPLSPQQIEELRPHVQTLNCSNCGAPIDLTASSGCTHCGSEISMVDLKQSQEMLEQLRQAAQPKPADPTLPLELLKVRHDMDLLFGRKPEPLLKEISGDLVHACLATVAGWFNKPRS
jgi:hypothetical protein